MAVASSPAWRLFNIVWAALLLAGALFQLNDPDPIQWVAVYGCAAGLSLAAALGHLHRHLPVGLGLVSLGWLLVIAAQGADSSNPMRGPGGWFEQGYLAEEVVREGVGLSLIVLGCATQAWVLRSNLQPAG